MTANVKKPEAKKILYMEKKFLPKYDINKIADFPINPPTRTDRKVMEELMISISRYGVIHSILIVEVPPRYRAKVQGKKYMAIDGHRRKRCSMLLGITTIDCTLIIPPKEISVEEIFNDVNGTPRKLSALESLSIFLKGTEARKAIPYKIRNDIQTINVIMGMEYLKELLVAGINPRSVKRRYDEVARVVDDKSKEFRKQFMKYFVKYPKSVTSDTTAALEYKDINKLDFVNSIRKMKPFVR